MDDELTLTADGTVGGPAGIGGRPREYRQPGRKTRVNVRFSEVERAEIEVAAAAIGMTATGFTAEAALLAARGTPVSYAAAQDREALARLQRQLFEARTTVNRFGNLVNQAVARLHTTGQPPIKALGHAVGKCTQAVRNLDLLVDELHRRLR